MKSLHKIIMRFLKLHRLSKRRCSDQELAYLCYLLSFMTELGKKKYSFREAWCGSWTYRGKWNALYNARNYLHIIKTNKLITTDEFIKYNRLITYYKKLLQYHCGLVSTTINCLTTKL